MPHIANVITEENNDLVIMLDQKQDTDFIEAVKK